MIISNKKIKVSDKMLIENNMLRGNLLFTGRVGIPINVNDISKGLIWKYGVQLTESDLDKLEDYFLIKQSNL